MVCGSLQVHSGRVVHQEATVPSEPGVGSAGADQSYMWHPDPGGVA